MIFFILVAFALLILFIESVLSTQEIEQCYISRRYAVAVGPRKMRMEYWLRVETATGIVMDFDVPQSLYDDLDLRTAVQITFLRGRIFGSVWCKNIERLTPREKEDDQPMVTDYAEEEDEATLSEDIKEE